MVERLRGLFCHQSKDLPFCSPRASGGWSRVWGGGAGAVHSTGLSRETVIFEWQGYHMWWEDGDEAVESREFIPDWLGCTSWFPRETSWCAWTLQKSGLNSLRNSWYVGSSILLRQYLLLKLASQDGEIEIWPNRVPQSSQQKASRSQKTEVYLPLPSVTIHYVASTWISVYC